MRFAACDGNCNVAALVNAGDGTESARYEYGPFGEPLRISGVMGKVNPLRFSTQYPDDFTGDLKYLYRDLREGRRPNRDPIEEFGGLNLYGFVLNTACLMVLTRIFACACLSLDYFRGCCFWDSPARRNLSTAFLRGGLGSFLRFSQFHRVLTLIPNSGASW